MITENKIADIARTIIRVYDPLKILLFGSYADGKPNYDSDLDFIIVKESQLPRHRRAFEIRKALIGKMVPLDILVYTPEEYEKELNDNYSFLHNALKNAKLLYDKAS